ncbi:hypothetical protein [Bacillus sp. V2I10]|uniref:hypothetical protein n=1 Tax=Bacillus sp. V2I10 TaxID=3042276 RepID=UPI00278AB703|nr:hypothetical protein [Bacillus sp. V2I10]MDQ0857683.1 hypothetical protein [Bacillus sp. V2I10]
MQIVIDLHYFVNGMKTLQCGYFMVNGKKFKYNPEEESARVAFEWFQKVKRDFIYDVDLYKVLYNQIDITEKVKTLLT